MPRVRAGGRSVSSVRSRERRRDRMLGGCGWKEGLCVLGPLRAGEMGICTWRVEEVKIAMQSTIFWPQNILESRCRGGVHD